MGGEDPFRAGLVARDSAAVKSSAASGDNKEFWVVLSSWKNPLVEGERYENNSVLHSLSLNLIYPHFTEP